MYDFVFQNMVTLKNCIDISIFLWNNTETWRTQQRTGWVLHLHHQSLEGVQGLQLLLLITQVFLQQTGPRLKLLGVQLVPVAI